MTTLLQKQRGFTLIEILISLVILSMLVTLAGSAYSIYIDRWKDNLGDFQQQLNETRGTILVEQSLGNIYPFVVDTVKNEDSSLDSSFFFFGEKHRIEAVTGSGVFNYANAGIFKVELKGQEILYYERSTADVLLENAEQSFTYKRKLRYLESVDAMSFRYFGWPSYKVKLEASSEERQIDKRQWYSSYDSVDRGLLPEIIEISITVDGQQWVSRFDVPDGSSMILGKYLDEN